VTQDPDLYLVPARAAEFPFTEKRSRFLAAVAHTTSRAKAEELLHRERKRHHDASHHCYAWVIGPDERHHDAGEPAGTAGRPILEAIHGAGLSDVTVVVSRYFGGVKLGSGGLKRAYAEAARGALTAAGLKEQYRTRTVVVSFEHADTSPVHHVAGRLGARPLGSAYGDRVALQFELRASRVDEFKIAITEATHGRAQVDDQAR
jgi:uncharacterized YigZ family protein